MNTAQKIQRLAALLNLAGTTVKFAPYKGIGERTHMAGFRVATLGPYRAEGQGDKGALVALCNALARAAIDEPGRLVAMADAAMYTAQRARTEENQARVRAERSERNASELGDRALCVTAELDAILAEPTEE